MIEFNVAAKAAAAEVGEDEDVVEVPIDGVTYTARRPTAAQVGLLYTEGGDSFAEKSMKLVAAMLGPDARKHLERLIWERRIGFDDIMGGTEENPKGLVSAILAEFAGRPTEPSTDSSESQPRGGRKSTGRAPGRGSTRSTSPSTDS